MKIFSDYDLSDVFKKYVGKFDIGCISPRIEQDKGTDKYKLRTYEYDELNELFNTQNPIHLCYGSYEECEKVLFEFNALFTILVDYNLTCEIIRAKYINPKSSKAMKKSRVYRKYNLNKADISEKEELLAILKEDIGE